MRLVECAIEITPSLPQPMLLKIGACITLAEENTAKPTKKQKKSSVSHHYLYQNNVSSTSTNFYLLYKSPLFHTLLPLSTALDLHHHLLSKPSTPPPHLINNNLKLDTHHSPSGFFVSFSPHCPYFIPSAHFI